MFSRTMFYLAAALVLISFSTHTVTAQARFSTMNSVHFDMKYIQGVSESEAHGLLGFLESEYDTLRNALGLEVKDKLEVRLYDSPGRYRSDMNMGREVLSAMYTHGILYALTTAPAQGLQKAIRYQLARVFLEQTGQRSCPSWLREAFAVYHSGIMSDLSMPGSVTVASFSDLTQDLDEASSPGDRNDVNYVLGRTMQFSVERYGKPKAYGVFKEFNGVLSVEKVFKKSFGEEYADIEKAWSKYVAITPQIGRAHV